MFQIRLSLALLAAVFAFVNIPVTTHGATADSIMGNRPTKSPPRGSAAGLFLFRQFRTSAAARDVALRIRCGRW